MKFLLKYIWIIVGALTTISGLVLSLTYIWQAILLRAGEPDQSLIFWYLPILFLGLMITTAGVVLLVKGVTELKK